MNVLPLVRASLFVFGIALLSQVVLVTSAHAVPASCNGESVKVTDYWLASDPTETRLGPGADGFEATAVACIPQTDGNDTGNLKPDDSVTNPVDTVNGIVNQVGGNIGLTGDGLFNGEGDITGYDPAFMDPQFGLEYLDIDNDGQATDPGWIMLGSQDVGQSFDKMSILGNEGVINDGIFDSTCTSSDCTSGTWRLTPDEDIPSRWFTALEGAGITNIGFFDAFSIVLKGGNGYSAYLFTAESLGISDLTKVHQFAGTFLMGDLTNGGGNTPGLSHISVWAHDPTLEQTQIPEPSTLALLGTALIGFGWQKGRRRC